MRRRSGHRGMADLGLDGEVVGLSMGQDDEDQRETAKTPIHRPRIRLGDLGHESKDRQITSERRQGHHVQERGFRC